VDAHVAKVGPKPFLHLSAEIGTQGRSADSVYGPVAGSPLKLEERVVDSGRASRTPRGLQGFVGSVSLLVTPLLGGALSL
jgi:hypothetical protein